MTQRAQAERRVILQSRLGAWPIGKDLLCDCPAFIDWECEGIHQPGREADQTRIGHRRRDQCCNRRFLGALGLLGKAQWERIWLVCLVHGRNIQCYSVGSGHSNDSKLRICEDECMFDWVHNRRLRGHEYLDEDDVDPRELERALGYIRKINSALGYTRSIIQHLKRFSTTWKTGQRIDIIDLATGSADIPRAILRWAASNNFDVHVVGVDRHHVTARAAAAQNHDPRLKIVQADVFALPFADQTFDYALTAMFLHHLDEEGIVAVLKSMDRLARRGIIASDVIRRRRAYLWI